MAEIRSCSLSRVAAEAGVAKSTASLALRGSLRVDPRTLARVKAVAARLGYLPDQRVGSLMARIRMAKDLHDREPLAFVWLGATKGDRRRDRFSAMSFKGARERAEQMGCVLEEFFLHEEGMTASRLEKILIARGITGVVFSAPQHLMRVAVDWNWHHFSAVRIGSTEFHPSLNRVEKNHYGNMWAAMNKLRAAGCRRPAGVLFELLHRRLHGMHRAAFTEGHPTPRAASGLLCFGLPESKAETLRWLKENKADGLVFVMNPSDTTLDWLRALPQLKLVVTLDLPRPGVVGILMGDQMMGSKAVDMLLAELHRNERGVPEHPTAMMLDGVWSE